MPNVDIDVLDVIVDPALILTAFDVVSFVVLDVDRRATLQGRLDETVNVYVPLRCCRRPWGVVKVDVPVDAHLRL